MPSGASRVGETKNSLLRARKKRRVPSSLGVVAEAVEAEHLDAGVARRDLADEIGVLAAERAVVGEPRLAASKAQPAVTT